MRPRNRHEMRQAEDPEILLGVRADQATPVAEHDPFSQIAPGAGHPVHPPQHRCAPREQRAQWRGAPRPRLGPPGGTRGTHTRAGDTTRPCLLNGQRLENRREADGPPEIGHVCSFRPADSHTCAVQRTSPDEHAHHRAVLALDRIGLNDPGPFARAAVGGDRTLLSPGAVLQRRETRTGSQPRAKQQQNGHRGRAPGGSPTAPCGGNAQRHTRRRDARCRTGAIPPGG